MTVDEFIQPPAKHPPDLRVMVQGYKERYDDLSLQQMQLAKINLDAGTGK